MKLFIMSCLLIFGMSQGQSVYSRLKTCHPRAVDVTFLIDASGSLGCVAFQLAKDFVANLTSQMFINCSHRNESARASFVTFSEHAGVVFDLKTYCRKADMLQAIHAVPYHGGGTHIGDAIQYVVDHEFVPSAGDRPCAADVLIVLTDGHDQGSTVSVAHAAAAAERKHIVTWAIGVGPDTDASELLTIAGGRADHVKHVESYSNLTSLYNFVCHAILNTTQPCLKREGQAPRCHYNSKTDKACEVTGGLHKCVPDNLDCVLHACPNDIGRCVPIATADKKLDGFCRRRTAAACPT